MIHHQLITRSHAKGPTAPKMVMLAADRVLARYCDECGMHPVRVTQALCERGDGEASFLISTELAPGSGEYGGWLSRQSITWAFGAIEKAAA